MEINDNNQTKKIEEIGKIKLDLTNYPGEDFYCDGEIEDTLLEIARDRSQVEFQKIIEESKSWPILYHLSKIRENIVEWLPITKDMKVLEVGAGCGAITGALAKKAGSVTCIDLSKKRSMINAYRHMDCDNVTICVGNFMDIEPTLSDDYDLICLIGVFEYGQAYTGGETPYEDLLQLIRKHLKKDGRIAIAIENKFGLKYWAGCREDHLGTFFSGLEDYPDGGVVRTFTEDGLRQIAGRCGIAQKDIHMYYPYPDYKFMFHLFSEKRMPKIGELKNNRNNFDRDRVVLFDEKRVFDSIIKEDRFSLFSNSYMMILGPEIDTAYVKYSNDRSDECAIKTVCNIVDGKKIIEKHALNEAGKAHIAKIGKAYEALTKRYENSPLKINHATLSEDGTYVTLSYIEGETLENLFDKMVEKNDTEGFYKLFTEYLDKISFGEESGVTDLDLVFSNIIIAEDGWHVIDYEWTVFQEIPANEVAFRALYCYLLEGGKRENFDYDRIIGLLSLKPEEMEKIRSDEKKFQKTVTGKRLALGEIRVEIGNKEYELTKLLELPKEEDLRDKMQIYEDTGRGFSEEESWFLSEDVATQEEITLQIPGGRRAFRIDPCSDCCIVYLKYVKWNGQDLLEAGKHIVTNGFPIGENTYGFDTTDPNITVNLEGYETKDLQNQLTFSMEVTRMPAETVKHLQKKSFWQKIKSVKN